MSQVLLIEPYKVLRQALTLFLSPEHEVRVQEETGGLSQDSLAEYDLIVVDGTALRDTGQLSPELTRALEACRAKIVWLEDSEAPPSVEKEDWVVVKKPIKRETLEKTLANLFSPAHGQRGREADALDPSKPKAEKPAKRQQPEDAQQPMLQFIELTDVVEEDARKKQKKAFKKSK